MAKHHMKHHEEEMEHKSHAKKKPMMASKAKVVSKHGEKKNHKAK